jgi:uncharacterized OsmC-like protein/alpha-beta hydrolase superfamily lysophospholipase
MQFQKLTFQNERGERLAARLDMPIDEKPRAFALFAHCFTCTKNLNAVFHINQALTRRGIAVLRFDFTGLGESEGDFSETNFRTNVSDLVSAANFLASNFEAPKLLIGHSLGGAAVLQAAAHIPSGVAVATIAAPFELGDLRRHLGSSVKKLEERGETSITLAGKTFVITKQFLDDLEQTRMEDSIRNLGRALLVFHSPRDTVVDIENAGRIFQAAKHPKSFVSLDQSDHLLSDRMDARYLGEVLAAWAGKFMRELEHPVLPDRDLTDNRVTVRTGKVGYQTEITANEHHLIADEPVSVGGANTGPTPYDYLVAALGACTSMTLRMYSDRKQLPLDAAVVRLRHHKIHAADCAECSTKEGMVDVIEREIELIGSLEETQRKRLLEIADRCPVHRTLHSQILVKTRLKEEGGENGQEPL